MAAGNRLSGPGALVIFDGRCLLCERSVQFIIRHDPKAYFRFASLQSEAGQKALAAIAQQTGKTPDAVVLLQEGKYYTGSDAAVRIARHLNGGWKLLSLFRFLPRLIREAGYNLLARNRYRWFGKKETCWMPEPHLNKRFL